MNILSMSLSASFIILAVIVIRKLFIHELPKRAFLLLWAIVIIRLLLPVAIPSRFSIWNIMDSFTASLPDRRATPVLMAPPPEPLGVSPIAAERVIAETTTAGPAPAASRFISGLSPLFYLWLAGFCISAACFMLPHLRRRKDYKTAIKADHAYINSWLGSHALRRKLSVSISDKVDVPLTYGIWKPVIILPRTGDFKDETRLSHILSHEYFHIRHFDILWKWIIVITLCLHWFNPLVWLMYVLVNRDIEISCDAAVVRNCGDNSKSAYAMTLIGLEENRSEFLSLSTNFSFSKNAIEERIVSIMKNKKVSFATVLAAFVLISGTGMVFATSRTPVIPVLGESWSGGSFPGKIAVITNVPTQSEEEFRAAENLKEKYGSDKVIHITWPNNFMSEQEQMISMLASLATINDLKVLVINQAVIGTNIAVDKLKETRNDVFIVYCGAQEATSEIITRADLIMTSDDMGVGTAIVKQAKKQGARVFVHYSFARHLSNELIYSRREIIRRECAREGIQYVEATAPDPLSEAGISGAQQFILEDVPKMVARYGENTAFFNTNCSMQIPLIRAVVDQHAIYPQPCCPSPFHGFPAALSISDGVDDISHIVAETRRIAASKNMSGRLSTWPVPSSMMQTAAGAEYAIRWLRGETPRNGIDNKILEDCINSYIMDVTGSPLGITMDSYREQGGKVFDHYKLILMDYLDY